VVIAGAALKATSTPRTFLDWNKAATSLAAIFADCDLCPRLLPNKPNYGGLWLARAVLGLEPVQVSAVNNSTTSQISKSQKSNKIKKIGTSAKFSKSAKISKSPKQQIKQNQLINKSANQHK
jgi:hypothetical protein